MQKYMAEVRFQLTTHLPSIGMHIGAVYNVQFDYYDAKKYVDVNLNVIQTQVQLRSF